MVGIFGVVDTIPSVMSTENFNVTPLSEDDSGWVPLAQERHSNDSRIIDDYPNADIETNQTHMSEALQILNVFVVVLSSFGLASTFLLLLGLFKNRRNYFLPWVGTVTCTTAVDYVYAVYLLIHNLEFLNYMTAIVFAGDFLLVLVNVYAIICVISQYQKLLYQNVAQTEDLGTSERLSEVNMNQPVEEIKLKERVRQTRETQPEQVDLAG